MSLTAPSALVVVLAATLIVSQTALIVWLLVRRAARRRMRIQMEERLGFEALLSELSAGLLHASADGLDAALEEGLGRVATFLDADRAYLDARVRGTSGVRFSWALPGMEESAHVLDAGQFPWTAERLERGEIVRFVRLDELPDEAALDRASYERLGTRSKASFPLRASGPMLGVLSFGFVRREREWPDEMVERLRLLSEAFAGALERRRAELSLAERLHFERLRASLSTTLGQVSAGDFDREVQRALRQVVDFLAVDRGSLIEFTRDGRTARSWAIEEWMDAGEFPWMTARLQRGDIVSVSELAELPNEAAVDRQSYLAHRVKPQVAVPLTVGTTVVGALVFSTVANERARSDELIQRLQLLGDIFAQTLARKQGELEAQQLRQELTHIGRVSALGELAASLAHELNQPLTAILSNAQAAQRFLAADALDLGQLREILGDIVEDDKRAADIIRRLRDLVKNTDPNHASLDLNAAVGEVAWLVRNDAILRNVALSLELAPDLPKVRGDRVQLQQVVLNLVLNGFDAMQDNGAAERTLAIRTVREGPAVVRVEVQDSGLGLIETDMDRIFQPLYTTKADGLGMGLAIARTIVHAHGGRIEAANNRERGVTFRFTLPTSQEDAP